MKKKILVLAVIAMSLSIMAYNTLAYFTAEDKVHNVITTNAVNIVIEEWQQTDDGLVPYPKEKPINVMPGVTVSKIVTVKNEDASAFIRAKFEVIVKDAQGKVMEMEETTLNSMIKIAVNDEYWLENAVEDGWYYYKNAVPTDTATEPLFTEVIFNGPNMSNEYQNCTVEINVDAQAVQTANNGSDVLNAAGWPAN